MFESFKKVWDYMISDDEKAKIKQEIVSKVNSVLEKKQ